MPDYPTATQLRRIRRWPWQNLAGLMEFVQPLWADYGYWRQDGDRYELGTGGWSGNEDIMQSLAKNAMFWTLCWQESKRGGHYIFVIPKMDTGEGPP